MRRSYNKLAPNLSVQFIRFVIFSKDLRRRMFFLILVCLSFPVSECQFAYPADPNPPQINTTFSCFSCEGAGCDADRVKGTHQEASCTGVRVACWTIKNTITSFYTRTCVRPPSIRQGVFCNRHMEGREFCYASQTARGRVRLCGKCCLNNRCNSGKIKSIPDVSLQTCVACQGSREEICNNEVSSSAENSTYVEQCLLPNSDCWTERRSDFNGKSIYSRGCQVRTCSSAGIEEKCTSTSTGKTCSKCCRGKLCNRFLSGDGSSATPSMIYTSTFAVLLLINLLC